MSEELKGPKPIARSRESQLRELQSALGASNASLETICSRLGVQSTYLGSVYEALEEGRWRNSQRPFAYVASVAKKKQLLQTQSLGPKNELRAADCGVDVDDWSYDDYERAYRAEEAARRWQDILTRLPEGFKKTVHVGPVYTDELGQVLSPSRKVPDFEVIAREAGFDEAELRVLTAKITGVGRDQAMTECPSDTMRLAVQAAWRRWDRSVVPRLARFVKKVVS